MSLISSYQSNLNRWELILVHNNMIFLNVAELI